MGEFEVSIVAVSIALAAQAAAAAAAPQKPAQKPGEAANGVSAVTITADGAMYLDAYPVTIEQLRDDLGRVRRDALCWGLRQAFRGGRLAELTA